jgi:hypothetical protein
MRKSSSEYLKKEVTEAMGQLPALVNIKSAEYQEMVRDHPFIGKNRAERDDQFGPVLVKKFADYDIITCQSNAGSESGQNGRVLLTYAVKSNEVEEGERLTTKIGVGVFAADSKIMTVFTADSKLMTVFAAKFAHLTGDNSTVQERTAKKFCYALTNMAHRIYEKFGIAIGADAKKALLYEFEKMKPIESATRTNEHDGGE